MDFSQIMEERWSCRAFRPDPIPGEAIDLVFSTAQRTASWCNTQPWHSYLLSGEAVGKFAHRLSEHVRTGAAASPDYSLPASYDGVYQERRRAAGYALYESLAIERSDRAGRDRQMLRNYSFFGAPHVAVLTSDRAQGTYAAVDCGGYVANLLNAAHASGLGAIAQGALGVHAGAVRQILGIGEDRLVLCGIALGYPDLDHPVNRWRTERARREDAVTRVTL